MVSIRARARSTVGHLVVYVVAVVAGLSSLVPDSGLAFFWPAAGVGALWMLSSRDRTHLLVDAFLLWASTVVVDVLMDVPLRAAVLFGLANLLIGLTLRAGSALSEATAFTGRLPRRVSGKSDLAALVIASLAAAVLSAPVGLSAAYLASGSLGWATAVSWIVRNTCSTFVVVAAVLAVLTALFRAHARRGWAARLSSRPRPFWLPELVLASTLALAATTYLFGYDQQAPVAFLLIVPATWVGYRFTPVVGGLFALVGSALAVLSTQAGRGPFATIVDPTSRAVTVQIYVLVITVLLLVLALGVSEREALIGRVVESEARATSRAELLDAVMNSITDGLIVFESSGEVMMRNPAAEVTDGNRRAPGTMGSPHDHGFFHLDGTPMEPEELPHARALAGELVAAEDILRIDPDTGHQAILSVAAVPLERSEEAGGRLAVLVAHDVTKEHSHRRELEAFAATVAHDLKAPLTGIGSWAEILGDQLEALDLDVTEPKVSLRRIKGSAVRMQQLISDLLGYSQAQCTTLKPTSLSLTGLVEEAVREAREASTGAPPLVEYQPLGQVLADRMLVRQLLANVIGNAVKYVAPGTRPHVRISSEVVGDMLEVRVADNGIGIPRAERGRIFDSFYRASSSGGYPGTGIGLAICARAVERHGGRISAREGIDGVGTTMIFTLPRDPAWADGEVSSDQPGKPRSEGAPSADDPAASRLREQLSPGS
jgi:signal transduction histidine kinase